MTELVRTKGLQLLRFTMFGHLEEALHELNQQVITKSLEGRWTAVVMISNIWKYVCKLVYPSSFFIRHR